MSRVIVFELRNMHLWHCACVQINKQFPNVLISMSIYDNLQNTSVKEEAITFQEPLVTIMKGFGKNMVDKNRVKDSSCRL